MSKKTKASKTNKSRVPAMVSRPRKQKKQKLDEPMWFKCGYCMYYLEDYDDHDELTIRTTEHGGNTSIKCPTCDLTIEDLENDWEKQ